MRGNESFASTPCPAPASGGWYQCWEQARAYVNGQAYLLDLTTGNSNSSSHVWGGFSSASANDTYCVTNCSTTVYGGAGGVFGGSQTMTFFVNASGLQPNDSFVLEVDLFGVAYAEMDAYGTTISGGHATASVNFASLGCGAKLRFISFST
ncbi:MAG: hypothetical protein L3K19_00205 [Thermoplasmata archaeon]|nr:hypothetical protein [Thermoplasmata archaeon]